MSRHISSVSELKRIRYLDMMEVPALDLIDTEKVHTFASPIKMIHEGHDVSRFLRTRAYRDITVFVLQLNRAIYPRRQANSDRQKSRIQSWEVNSPDVPLSEAVSRIRNMLTDLDAIVDEVPPDPGPRRFGNASFRQWYEKVETRLPNLLQQHLPVKVLSHNKVSDIGPQAELQSYFLGAFGSPQRLDYGSGHELSFLAFLACIWKLGGFDVLSSGNEERAIVLGIIEP